MKPYLCFLALLFTLILSAGCGSPVTKDNYDRIETGMTLDEVESILGSGTEQGSSDTSFGGISMNVKNMVWRMAIESSPSFSRMTKSKPSPKSACS